MPASTTSSCCCNWTARATPERPLPRCWPRRRGRASSARSKPGSMRSISPPPPTTPPPPPPPPPPRWLMAGQRWTDALDELLEILMRDKGWNDEAARKTCVAVLEIIEPPKPKVAEGQIPPEDPVVASYRRRLSSVVLS